MGRKRATRKDEKLPPYVCRLPTRNRVTLKYYLGKGKFGPTHYLRDRLGKPLPADAPVQAIFEAYKMIEFDNHAYTLSWLFNQYFKSTRYTKLADATRRNYRIHADSITASPLKNGQVFGQVDLAAITPTTIAKYRDKWETDKPVAVIREMQFMSAVFSWGVEQGSIALNPAKGVRKPSATARDRYVSQDEMTAVQNAVAKPYLAVAMEIAYLCRARASEVLALQRQGDIKRKIPGIVEEGIYIKRTKGSDSEITLWTPRLREATEKAKILHRDVISPHLIYDEKGSAITYRALRSAFVRALKKSKMEKFTFHDLKAAGISDHKNQAGGHRSARMRDTYVRVPEKIEATC